MTGTPAVELLQSCRLLCAYHFGAVDVRFQYLKAVGCNFEKWLIWELQAISRPACLPSCMAYLR